MDFEKLVGLGIDSLTARYSDDGSAIERDRARLVKAVSEQDTYTLEQVEEEALDRLNESIRRMNKND